MGETYERLTALDEAFFWLEQKNAPMHVASTLIFDEGDLGRSDGGINADAIRDQIASKLHRVPRYRQKITWIPFARRPVWVDDHGFELDYHVRHTSLPRPGNDWQLKRLCASMMEQPLDRDRPLWQVHIIEGVSEGRFALFVKVHHCMVDGVSGIDLLSVLLNPQPGSKPAEPQPFTPRPNPNGLDLWRDEMRRRIAGPMSAVRDLSAFVAHTADSPTSLWSRIESLGTLLQGTLRRPTPTPFNQPISTRRRMEWFTIALEPIERIRGALGGTVNDVVLAAVTGAMRRYLTRRKIALARMDVRAMTPVSTRNEDPSATLGNRVSAWVVDLPVGEPDPRKQLGQIRRATHQLKESELPIGASVVTEMSEWTSSTLLISLTARHVTRLLPCNLVVTNIPGPPFPLFLGGATMREAFPFVPLVDGLALNIAVTSYDGKLCWGINADYEVVPDPHVFADAIRDAADELYAVAFHSHSPKS